MGAMVRLIEQGRFAIYGLERGRAADDSPRQRGLSCRLQFKAKYSLWTRDYEVNTIPTVRELGIGFVSYYARWTGLLCRRGEKSFRFRPQRQPTKSSALLSRELRP